MIWLIMSIFVSGVLLYVAKPLYAKDAPVMQADSEIASYLAQITDIEIRLKNADSSKDVDALELAKLELQRQVLAKQGTGKDAGPQTVLLSILFIVFTLGTVGIYVTLGRPDLTKTQEVTQSANPLDVNDLTLEQAVAQLEQKLEQGDQSPQGWMLYARSLMSLGRYDDAIAAYKKVLLLTDNNPEVLAEFENAKGYIKQKQIGVRISKPGPSAEQIKAAEAMTPQARQDMVLAMVDRLSLKLKDNPEDVNGWTRLLRARKVLGQDTQARADITNLREIYKNNPEVVEKILADTGWAEN